MNRQWKFSPQVREQKREFWKWKAEIWELTRQGLPLSWSLRSDPCSLTSAVSMELLSLVLGCQATLLGSFHIFVVTIERACLHHGYLSCLGPDWDP